MMHFVFVGDEKHPIDQHMSLTRPSPNSCWAALVIDWAPSAIRTLEQYITN